MKFFSLLVALSTLVTKVAGNSSGTGSCAAGIGSVGGTHLDYGPNSVSMRQGAAGTLTEAAVVVAINGVTVTPGTDATFDSGVDLTWSVTSQVPYKGIFVRVQAGSDNIFTLTGDGTGLSSVALCDALTDNVSGINHNSAVLKTSNSGVMNFAGSGSVSMDVTLVFDNIQTSVYASSTFPLTIGGGAPVAPVAPVPGVVTDSPAGIPTEPVPTEPTAPVPGTPAPAAAPTEPTAPVPTEPPTATEPTAPTSDECPEGSGKGKGGDSGKGKGGDSGKGKGGGSGKMMMCKGGMMMGMETKSPKSPKTPKAEDGKGKGGDGDGKGKGGDGKGKGDGRRYLK